MFNLKFLIPGWRTAGDRGSDEAAWRRKLLRRNGFSDDLAVALADSAEVDVHAVLELVSLGCPPELAARIRG